MSQKIPVSLPNSHKWSQIPTSPITLHFLPTNTVQPFKHVKDNCSRLKKCFQGFPPTITRYENQFFAASCLTCPQDQTTAVLYYWGQNISTNSYFLQPTEKTSLTITQFSASYSTFREFSCLSFWLKNAIKPFHMCKPWPAVETRTLQF